MIHDIVHASNGTQYRRRRRISLIRRRRRCRSSHDVVTQNPHPNRLVGGIQKKRQFAYVKLNIPRGQA